MGRTAAILDVDGTLVDTNYQHALCWFEALRQHGATLPVWRIHRHIGMGGDQLVAALTDDAFEAEHGDDVRAAEAALYGDAIRSVAVLDGAVVLLDALREEGREIVLASSAKAGEVDHYLDLLDARERVTGWTTSADVERTKPHPDLVAAALERLDADEAVLVGDTPWDVEAAERAGVPTIAVLTGGFSEAELRDAGAVAVFEDVPQLLARRGETPLG
ncbi:HAD family hydrolase [Patulibacter brassicae]|uniref:HAD family hydrolase n=1 Tax=Patulibacter brassicae TaxID=1705717 RepID=A0ABU4VMN1_9ACTN|nr:HAD family hydrolase [Patulibacter brassicae]MDX8152148.1 HAD family hydrolase [Patulibacter brassicae]